MENRTQIIELMKSNQLENIELAFQLCKGSDNEILAKICDFLIQSFDDSSNYVREIQYFLWKYMEDYPNHELRFTWYDTSMEDCPAIEDLPEAIGALVHLQFLDLGGMDVRELPKSFSNLKNLVELDLSLCRLDSFPSELRGLNKLKKLDLEFNGMHEVRSSAIWGLSNLEYINLAENNIEVLPDDIKYLENLKELNLKDNPLAASVKKRIKELLPNCKVEFDDLSAPNIFTYATSELSQDAFFAWLIQWTDYKYSKYNQELHAIARQFVSYLIGNDYYYYGFNNVQVGRQWNGIDIWVEIDDKIFIAIEDKTNTQEHSNQLERYKKLAEENYKDKEYELRFIYLKTWNESKHNLDIVSSKGYKVVDRAKVLEIFSQYPVKNNIFNDFLSHLTSIEEETNSYSKFGNLVGSWRACEGFYTALEKKVHDSGWGQVNNPSGAFLGFYYHWMGNNDFGSMYIQIENRFDAGIQVVIKVSDDDISVDKLYNGLGELTTIAEKHGIALSKPAKYRAGATSTLAVLNDAFPSNLEAVIDVEAFHEKLKKLEAVIDEYCEVE